VHQIQSRSTARYEEQDATQLTKSSEATGQVTFFSSWQAITLHNGVQMQLLLVYSGYDLQVAGPKPLSKACHRSQLVALSSQTRTDLASSCSCQQYLIKAKDSTQVLFTVRQKQYSVMKSKEKAE
jgi:hypothetical protein